jgi:diguanylate cyclase (GGDEF)-like protein
MALPADTPQTALVIDDDPAIRLLATRTLEASGVRVVSFADGENGLVACQRQMPDIVLVDVLMPGIDGYEFTRALRASGRGRSIPILMLTGLDDIDSINRAYEAGATDFISKPINWAILGHRIRYILRAADAFADALENQALLASAQRVARLGSWRWNLENGKSQWSEETYRILGYEPGQVEPTVESLLARIHPEDRSDMESSIAALRQSGRAEENTRRILLGRDEVRYVRVHTYGAMDENGVPVHAFGAIQDVTDSKLAQERINALAFFDPLTGLPNRHQFRDHLTSALHEAKSGLRRVAVLSLDLDQFKRINDTFGHAFGDQFLTVVADRLRVTLRSCGASRLVTRRNEPILARLGGDEFCILLRDPVQVESASAVARSILDGLRAPLEVEGRELFVTTSVGIAVHPEAGRDADTLMKNADAAMYFAKNQGRNNFQFYGKDMNARALERLALESSLRKAIERQEFELHYQPKLDIRHGRIVGVEALIRWHHPDMGYVAPDNFIPLAEDLGLIVSIGQWVLREAAAQTHRWHLAGLNHLRVAVNIASSQFHQSGFAQYVEDVLRQTQLPPDCLELEVTESILMNDQASTLATLADLKAMGVRLSIDDFGTGYSSLSYLRRFPVDSLKVDKSFIKDTPLMGDDAAITSAILAMAHSLRLEVVAEGVETAEQLEFLRQRKCEYIQGFLISRALPARDIPALIAQEDVRFASTAA